MSVVDLGSFRRHQLKFLVRRYKVPHDALSDIVAEFVDGGIDDLEREYDFEVIRDWIRAVYGDVCV